MGEKVLKELRPEKSAASYEKVPKELRPQKSAVLGCLGVLDCTAAQSLYIISVTLLFWITLDMKTPLFWINLDMKTPLFSINLDMKTPPYCG